MPKVKSVAKVKQLPPPLPVTLTDAQVAILVDFVYKVAQHKVMESAPFTGIALKAQAQALADHARQAFIQEFSAKVPA